MGEAGERGHIHTLVAHLYFAYRSSRWIGNRRWVVRASGESAGDRAGIHACQLTEPGDFAALSAWLPLPAFDLLSNLAEFPRKHLAAEISLDCSDDRSRRAGVSISGSDPISAGSDGFI